MMKKNSPKRLHDPFAEGLTLEERNERAPGVKVFLKRQLKRGSKMWEEGITLTGIRRYDETSGLVECFAVAGTQLSKFDPYRESGANRAFELREVVRVKIP